MSDLDLLEADILPADHSAIRACMQRHKVTEPEDDNSAHVDRLCCGSPDRLSLSQVAGPTSEADNIAMHAEA